MLWINGCLLAVSDVEGTSAIVVAPLTVPGCLVRGSMQHPQLHASLQQLPDHITVVILSCLCAAWQYCRASLHNGITEMPPCSIVLL